MSALRDVSCVECHMAATSPSVRDHRFTVSRNPALLSRAIAVGAPRAEQDRVVFILRSVGVGHRFPTGDIFRRLLVHAWLEDEGGRIVADREIALSRDWQAHRQARAEVLDSRLDDSPRELAVPLPSARPAHGLRLFVRVNYERGFEARAGHLELFASDPILEQSFAL